MGWLDKTVGAGVGYAVAGPGGALVGALYAGNGGSDPGYDMSDIPYGVHVEAAHEDDAVGRRWTLSLLSEVAAGAHVRLRILDDAGKALLGHAPFADGEGAFAASAPIRQGGVCVVYVPFGAVRYTSKKNLSLEVSVWTREPHGKAVLDADLPAPVPWDAVSYVEPMLVLCEHVATSDAQRRGVRHALAQELGIPEDAVLEGARTPMTLQEAVTTLKFRFPNVDADAHVALIRAVGDVESTASRERLASITARLRSD